MDRQETAGPKWTASISPALAAAQHKLENLRQAHRPNQIERPTPTGAMNEDGRSQNETLPVVEQTRPIHLPQHLGWHSAPATRAYRRALQNLDRTAAEKRPSSLPPLPAPPTPLQTNPPPNPNPSLNIPPDIALAILRNKLAAPGRIWLLLRHLDQQGKGWVAADEARERLSGQESPLAVCGERQLRNLLAAGDGIFWERDEERLWLKSMARAAAVLGLSRLNGRPVSLPLEALLGTIGAVRAHLYATFHSSRNGREHSTRSDKGRPVSRKILKELSSASRRTQRLYERRVGVRAKANYAVGPTYSAEAEQNLAWQHGQALFRFQDRKGLMGKAGREYLAWQLPNSYDGPHQIQSKGYQRRINRQLADLLTEGITGNGGEKTIDEPQTAFGKAIFCHSGDKAAKLYNRGPDRDLYWQSRVETREYDLWHALPALNRKSRR